MMIYEGTVKWYNSEKKYGFITRSNGTDLFFHMNNGEKPKMSYFNGNVVVVSEAPCGYCMHEPKVGEEVIYDVGLGSKGYIAKPWVYKKDHDFVLRQIKNLPLYRVMRRFNNNITDELWRGIWLGHCSTLYYDPEFDGVPFNHDDFKSEKWWETKPQDSTETEWKKCECPLTRKK